jgi:hypothetical protein
MLYLPTDIVALLHQYCAVALAVVHCHVLSHTTFPTSPYDSDIEKYRALYSRTWRTYFALPPHG